jgi:hypothetical protein
MTPTKRPPRRIYRNGKLLNPTIHGVVPVSPVESKAAKSTKRVAIVTTDGLMNEVAAAEYLGRSVSTLQNRRSEGLLPKYLKQAGRIYYRREDLDDFRNT